MRSEARWISRVAGVSLVAALLVTGGLQVVHGQAQHVTWDIISLVPTTPFTFNPGGEAFANARNPSTLRIRLTGSGSFVAPASGGSSGAAKGGGTWQTFNGATLTASGTFSVSRVVIWRFGSFQTGAAIDNIGDVNERANGSAVLLIQYSDGTSGILGIGCHGPGAPDGIVEGVIATKDFVTYWDAEAPGAPSVDKNRTVFHIEH